MATNETRVDPTRLRLMRKTRRWTQDELSQAAGLSLRTIQRAEKSGAVSIATLKSLAAVFEIDAGELEANKSAPRSRIPAGARQAFGYVALVVVAIGIFWVAVPDQSVGHTTPIPSKETVAVLPFVALSSDNRSLVAADKLTHDLTLMLRRNEQADVLPERDSRAISLDGLAVKQVGNELSATLVVEGSVRLDSDRVRVTVQVIDVNFAAYLWSNSYDRNADDIDGIVPHIVRSIEATYRY